ncbi:arabinogalactan endo-1,4-beta-galactosidase [Mycena alexandri]|uniref:Arabinogalactan endo-beta-1,4-galactanase n=1 Tax=Mycena alexandri TaxID=1745969 RepID=A0AAD6XBM6_9AGAR|nr:arabinogalactan endo-1,4-beta-galactosidase [Mycena alexandri]
MLFSRLAVFLSLSVVTRLGHALTYHGADFSSLVLLENSGIQYHDAATSSSAAKFETILAKHGANLARIRIWTSTNNQDYSLTYGLALAKRAVAAGMSLLIDLHFSDTWADPGHQAIPAGWPTTLAGLNTQIFTYTNNLVKAFSAQGTPIQFIEIGNEINDGILWPVGQISVNGYSPLSQLLHSAVSGVRQASSTVRTVIHLANGWDAEGVSSFYQQIFIAGEFAIADVDVMGFSFYPFYGTGATLSALQSSLQAMVTKYAKDVMVVETDWPESCSGVALSQPSIAISAAGQQSWVLDIRNVLSALSGGHGIGIAYWEPGWIGNAGLGSSCADNLLVDGTGTTRASIAMFSADM